MKTKLTTIVAVSVLTLGLAACEMHNKPYNPAPGSYDKTSRSTDANGTTYEQDNSTDVTVDSDGRKKTVVRTKTTKDPKGLMNKTTTSKTRVEVDAK
jgi:hypothetical protein